MYDDILIPTDGSDESLATLEHAVEVGAHRGATLHVLFVVNKRLYIAAPDDEERERVRADLEKRGDDAIEATVEAAREAGVDVVSERRDGVPHREILRYVDEHGVDLVVMGTHGRTGRDRLESLGSVTERVVEAAGVPVFVVPIGDGGE